MIESMDPATRSTFAAAAGAERTALGGNEFMQLLLTQLRHQDPLSPLEPHEFAAQLASFSSVEQLSQLNEGMAYQLESVQLATALSKTSFSAALIGRSVLADGNKIHLDGEEAGEVVVDVGGAAGGTAVLKVFDESGREVAVRDLGVLEPGRRTLALPDDLAEGTYTYAVTVENGEGTAVPVTTYTSGTVERVIFENGRIMLRVDGIDVVLESLMEVGGNPVPA